MKNNVKRVVANKLPLFSAECFTYETWEVGYWDMLGLGYAESMEAENLFRAIKEYGIGYCNSSRLSVRPREDVYVAVMCERDGIKFWFHILRDDVSELLLLEDS